MKKIFLTISLLIFIVLIAGIISAQFNFSFSDTFGSAVGRTYTKLRYQLTICDGQNDPDCVKCVENGGKMIPHSFGSNCEMIAKDAGKKCISDNECDKNLCVYASKYDVCDNGDDKDLCLTHETSNGYCDKYSDGEGTKCHRPKGEGIICDGNIS